MGIKKFFKNRFNIIYLVMAALLVVLCFKMAVLTIVEGQDYRDKADEKKIKDIPVKAPRGKIYDRNGVLLADNVTSFTVQMYQDQMDADNFNDVSYILSQIFDENGERPIDELPIVLDTFEYIDESIETVTYETSEEGETITADLISAQDKVVGIVKDNLDGWLEYTSFIYGESFNVKNNVMNVFKKDANDIPVDLKGGILMFTDTDDKVAPWLEENGYVLGATPDDIVKDKLKNENKYMVSLFSNSKVRRLSYEYINSIGLGDNLKLVGYSFLQDNEYKKIKKGLMEDYPEITEVSSAKDDFVLITMKNTVDILLNTIYESDGITVIPGRLLCERLKSVYPDLPVECSAADIPDADESTDGPYVKYEYTDILAKNRYLEEMHLDEGAPAYDLIRRLADRNPQILESVITDDTVKYHAQEEMLKIVNPYISVADKEWEYTPVKNKKQWITSNLKGKAEGLDGYDAKNVFDLLRETLKIDDSINDYEMRNMLVIRERYTKQKQSYMSYHPIDICYGITEKSVSMISERAHELDGIEVEIEPIRYYPMEDSAAHIIGYLGKIAQDYEIEKYVNNPDEDYTKDDIIGKTGIEESFERYLKGKKGKKTVEVNNVGKTIKSLSREEPVPGDNLTLTIDIRLQKKAEEVLEKGLKLIREGGVYESEWGDFRFNDAYKHAESGAIVAIDVKTGELLAMANYPSYDLNLFATGVSSEDWNSLNIESKNPLAPKPLYNIAMQTAVQPGSTFKLVTSLAALEKGVDPYTRVYCPGAMEVGGRKFRCWINTWYNGAHGYMNMYDAIRVSCNSYFYTTLLGENPATNQKHTVKVEVQELIDTAKMLGLNDKTGIEISLPEEFSGGVPSIESKVKRDKLFLQRFLESSIDNFYKDGVEVDESGKKEIIEEILSWMDSGADMTRGEVFRGLEALGIDPEKLNGREPFGDTIKYSYLNQAGWRPGDSLNMSIGQGDHMYTPLQMANYIATIANGGYHRNISVVKDLEHYDGTDTDYVPKREAERIDIRDYDELKVLMDGMLLVSADDGARPYANFPVQVGTKTGTAQKDGINPDTGEEYDDFAWYVAYAPYDDPQIAVACILVQGGSGRYPTPLVRELIAEYLRLNGTIEDKTSEDEQNTESGE